MTTDIATSPKGYQIPICNKCKRPVEYMALETPTRVIPSGELFGISEVEHTGEQIIIIRCHGEEWRMSNKDAGFPNEFPTLSVSR